MVVPWLALTLALGTSPTDLEAAMAELRAAESATNELQEDGRARLQAALKALHDLAPELSRDRAALDARALAQVSLARSFLRADDRARANAAMDEAIRITRTGKLPFLGAQAVQLEAERREAMEEPGRGGIAVTCQVPCRVILDEQTAAERVSDLLLGTYRIWIEARDGSGAPWRTEVTVATPGEWVTLSYPSGDVGVAPRPEPLPAEPGGIPVAVEEPHDDNPLPATPRSDGRARILPRWASASMILVGTGVAGVGGALLGIDGTCQGPNKDTDTCERIYTTSRPGIALVAGGAVLAVVGAALLTVDEVRRSRRQRISLGPGGLTIGF